MLRGHEGGPLVIGNIMYVHTPFPNTVYALDLSNDNKIVWKYEPKQDPNVIPVMCCDTVNRGLAYGGWQDLPAPGRHHAGRARRQDRQGRLAAKNGDPGKGETGTSAPVVIKDKVLVGISGGEFGVQCHMTAYDIKTGKQVWRAYSEGPDDQILVDPTRPPQLGKPIGKDFEPEDLAGRSVEDRRRLHLGLDLLRSRSSNLVYYGSGNPSTWNPKQRPGDNKWSMTDLGAQPG